MRNLKRVLSLALALVMVLGMMVITTSAADFGDADEITYNEAVDVISAIGVITGDNGNFYPTRALTREEGAAFVCYLLMGKDAADKLPGTGVFSDVKASRWSAGEIEYCANLGILGGNGDGTFAPSKPLTAVMFGKMLLCALGYDATIEGYGGGNWASNIAADMIEVGLDVKGVEMDAVLTREQAAQMALKAIQCDLVKYSTKGTNISIDGIDISTGASEAESVYSDDTAIYANIKGGTLVDGKLTLQFAEKYFPNLTKIGDTDGMARPSFIWAYGLEEIGEYASTARYTTVAKPKMPMGTDPKAADVVDTISKNLNDSSATLWVNGVSQTYATYSIKIGSDVEIFLNLDGTVNKVVVTEYSATTVLAATATKTDKGVDYISINGVTPGYVKAENVFGDTDLSKFDVVLFYKDTDGNYTIEKADSVTGTVTGVHSDKGLQVAGNYYLDSAIVGAANTWSNDYNNTYVFYLDRADRVVKAVKITDDLANNYVVVAEVAWVTTGGVDADEYLEARIVKADATTEVVKIASVNGIKPVAAGTVNFGGTKYYASNGSALPAAASCTTSGTSMTVSAGNYYAVTNASGTAPIVGKYYCADASNLELITTGDIYAYELDRNGNYELSTSPNGNDAWAQVNTAIKYGDNNANVGAPTNDSTVFVYATVVNGQTKYTAYTGFANVPTATGITQGTNTIVKGADGFAKLVYVAAGTVAGAFDADLVYVADNAYLAKKVGNTTLYTYDGLIINGVPGSMTLTNSSLTEGDMYVVSASDASTGAKTLSDTLTGFVDTNDYQTGIAANGGNSIVIGSNTYTYTADTVVYYIDEDGNSTQITADAIGLDATDAVYVVVDPAVTTKAVKMYVIETTNAPTALSVAAGAGASISGKSDLVGPGSPCTITGLTLGTTNISVTPTAHANTSVVLTAIGNGTNATLAEAAADAAVVYCPVAGGAGLVADSVVTITATVTDGFSGTQSVYTYTIAVSGT